MENIYHNLKGNTNPKTISNINRWNRPQLRDWKAFWPNSTFHPFTYIILDLSLSLYRQVPLNFSLSNSNTQINHWRTFISMHWHFFSLSLMTIWTIFFKSRTDTRKYGSIHVISVQLYKTRCTLKRRWILEVCWFLTVVDLLLKVQLKWPATFRSKATFPMARKRLPLHKTLSRGKKGFRSKILQVMP